MRGISSSHGASSSSASFSCWRRTPDHSSSALAVGVMRKPPSGTRLWSSPFMKKALTAIDSPATLCLCDMASERSSTIMPGTVLTWHISMSSSSYGWSSRKPVRGPRNVTTMIFPRRNCDCHLVTAFSVSGGASSSASPARCTTAPLRCVMSMPMPPMCGATMCPRRVMALSMATSDSLAPASRSATWAEPSEPRRPSAITVLSW
mmetsp:Transcript_117615/g.163813  ORF Transcript_117615/g.163813 Transcript_117615/m.163813 type:complete len:205 (+) Transcript_117615:73-687(+)